MPRPKNSLLYNFFDKKSENKAVCKNGNCNSKMLYNHCANLERHLRVHHPNIYANYIEKKVLNKKPKPLIAKVVSTDLNRNNAELAIVELFTKNNLPLHMAEEKSFKILVQPVFSTLGICVNEHNINERIIAFAQKIKTEIISDLNDKLLSLKIDAATMQDLSVLGINVQYIKNQSIQIKTLAVKELKSSHTSEYLKAVIQDVLIDYSININQILTITTDLNEDLNEDFQNSIEESVEQIMDEEKIKVIRSNFSSYSITGVRCGAHILQLCVHDVIRVTTIKNILDKCRSVVKKLETQTYSNIFKNGRYKKPLLDCVTRLNSTFVMLDGLLEIKEIIKPLSSKNSGVYLSPGEWNFVKEFIQTFKPIYIATNKLKLEQLCFSELYIIMMDIKFQLESLPSSEMVKLLVNSIEKQKDKLFNIELFNAAVFLDPRIKICMNTEQKERATKYITCLCKRMNSLKEMTSETIDNIKVEENTDGPSTSNHTLAKSFSEFLENLDPECPEPISSSITHLNADLIMYDRQPRLTLDSNIIEYWSEQKNSLSGIADIILAIPLTQVSVERLFSALKYILSDQRNRLPAFNVEHILLVKANGIFEYEV